MKLTPINELIDTKTGEARTRASVGGYTITFIGDFDDTLCGDCVNSWTEEGIREHVKGGFIHWEGAPLTCESCGTDIESEYGDPDEDDMDHIDRKVEALARYLAVDEEALHVWSDDSITLEPNHGTEYTLSTERIDGMNYQGKHYGYHIHQAGPDISEIQRELAEERLKHIRKEAPWILS